MAARATTVRILEPTHKALVELAAKLDRPITRVVAEAVEAYRRKVFWEEFNQAVARLRADPQAWAAELVEREVMEGTLRDGLEPEEWTDADVITYPTTG